VLDRPRVPAVAAYEDLSTKAKYSAPSRALVVVVNFGHVAPCKKDRPSTGPQRFMTRAWSSSACCDNTVDDNGLLTLSDNEFTYPVVKADNPISAPTTSTRCRPPSSTTPTAASPRAPRR
jgi:hypothetical protein